MRKKNVKSTHVRIDEDLKLDLKAIKGKDTYGDYIRKIAKKAREVKI